LRDRYDEIRELGAEIVAIGTGDVAHAREFVEAEGIPFPVLVDDDGAAARAAEIRSVGLLGLFDPRTAPGTVRALRKGFRVGRPGKRVTQLGATFVVGPGDTLHYEYRDAHSADHAPPGEVLAALSG